ncbi:MAG: protein kinase family protein, partial [Planctomycetes bacterium]|nr:protein kinase family protein [Planctomycetota bacterium]
MKIPGYKIKESIYCRQSVEILRAVRKSDGLPVILKVKRGLFSSKSENDLNYEKELSKTLEGERSAKPLALERTSQELVLVLQDDKMNSLDSEIPHRGFDLPRFLKLAIEIVSAIEEIHSQNVIHRDICPANIIVNSAFNTVKIIDFSLATRFSEEMVGFEPPA